MNADLNMNKTAEKTRASIEFRKFWSLVCLFGVADFIRQNGSFS